MERVSLVRIDSQWHVFTDMHIAWSFYSEWRDFRDCEFMGEVPVDVEVDLVKVKTPQAKEVRDCANGSTHTGHLWLWDGSYMWCNGHA